jgi:hypothetical protein
MRFGLIFVLLSALCLAQDDCVVYDGHLAVPVECSKAERKNQWKVAPSVAPRMHWWNRHRTATILGFTIVGVGAGVLVWAEQRRGCNYKEYGGSGSQVNCPSYTKIW